MFKRIVVGTDGSETAAVAVGHATQLAKITGAALEVVSAFEPVPQDRLRSNPNLVQLLRDGLGHFLVLQVATLDVIDVQVEAALEAGFLHQRLCLVWIVRIRLQIRVEANMPRRDGGRHRSDRGRRG